VNNQYSLQEVKDNIQREIPKFQEKNPVMCSEIFLGDGQSN
jgi:hypothetical protein